jgi:hypothetical protein
MFMLAGAFLVDQVALTHAQPPKALVIRGAPKADVKESFGLVEENLAAAAANRQKLQERINAGAPEFPWFFRGSSVNLWRWMIDRTLILKDGGREITGIGAQNQFGGAFAHYGSYLSLPAVPFATTFDGGAKSGSTMGASAVVTIVGRPVVPEDKFNSVQITGGTNFVPGWYTITEVSAGPANTWTLDRNCTKGGGSGMTGFYCPTLLRDHGAGTSIRGIGFLGRLVEANTIRGSIGYHVPTFNQTGVTNGKLHLENCSWDGFHTAILFGPGMAHYGDSVSNWYGWNFNNADEGMFTNLTFRDVENCFLVRNSQAVGFLFNKVKVYDLAGTVFRFDSGGKFTATDVEVQGNALGTPQRVLYLGRHVVGGPSGLGPFILTNITFDGGDTTRNPQLITTDLGSLAPDRSVRVEFNGVLVNRAAVNDSMPLIDIQSRCYVTVRNASNAFWEHSVRLRYGADSNQKPILVLENCSLLVEDPADMIDESNSDSGIKVILRSCTNSSGELIGDANSYTKVITTTGK